MLWRSLKSGSPARAAKKDSAPLSDWADSLPALLGFARTQPPSAQIVDAHWQKACEAYRRFCASQGLSENNAAQGFNLLHRTVADLLWDHKSQVALQEATRVVHISNPTLGLLAVCCPVKRLVQVRKMDGKYASPRLLEDISLRVMPSSATLLEGQAASGFEPVAFAWLMWQFGQYDAKSLNHLPVLTGRLLYLRRFPTLQPHLLSMRHLSLMHALSRHPVSFDQLDQLIAANNMQFICPDLTALYLTGALQIKNGF